MRYLPAILCAALIGGCVDPCNAPSGWTDELTGCDFVLGEPSAKHYAMWVATYEAAQSIWSQTPCPIRVTIIETPEELVYFDGEWEEWKVGRLGFATFGDKVPEIFIAGFFPDDVVPLIMAHELVHVVWRISEHPDIFWEHNDDLLAAMGII